MLVRALSALSDAINRAAEWLLGGVGMSMALIIALQVFFRYALNNSLFWSEELGRMLLVWLTFLGASVAYKRGAHIGLDFVVERLPESLAKAARLAAILVSLFLFAVMAIWGLKFLAFIAGQKTAAMGLSKQVPFVMVPVSGLIMFLHGLCFLARELAGRRS